MRTFTKPYTHLRLGYDGDDIPTVLPVGDTIVQTTIEETIHFNKSLEGGTSEWNYLFPPGGGAFVMGKQDRAMINALYHQMHCVDGFSRHIRGTDVRVWAHVRHCLEYLLAASLCQADATLEPGDFTAFDYSQSRPGEAHVCRDWEAQYSFLRENFVQYSLRTTKSDWWVQK